MSDPPATLHQFFIISDIENIFGYRKVIFRAPARLQRTRDLPASRT